MSKYTQLKLVGTDDKPPSQAPNEPHVNEWAAGTATEGEHLPPQETTEDIERQYQQLHKSNEQRFLALANIGLGVLVNMDLLLVRLDTLIDTVLGDSELRKKFELVFELGASDKLAHYEQQVAEMRKRAFDQQSAAAVGGRATESGLIVPK